MKKTFLIFALLIGTLIGQAQPLTYRGGNEMPAEMLLSTFVEWQPGDIIYSAYFFEGQLYASWKDLPQPSETTGQFFIRAMADDGSPVQTGVKQGEEPYYLLYRNGEFTFLNVTRTKKSSYWGEAMLMTTDVRLTLNDNLYYSICPQWPDSLVTKSRIKPTAGQYLYFYKFLNFNEVLPKYYSEIAFTLATGTGKLYPAKTMNYYRYQFSTQDIARGYIELNVIVTPLKNCTGTFNQIIKINL